MTASGHPPDVRISSAGYENIVAACPACKREVTFNRASDLGTFDPIGGREVVCQHDDCRQLFRIISDSINPPHDKLLSSCIAHIKSKRYMECIKDACQAHEMFFKFYLKAQLISRPWHAGEDTGRSLDDLNRLARKLHAKIGKLSFADMRSLFLASVVRGLAPPNLAEAEQEIDAIPKRPGMPRKQALESVSDVRLKALLLKLYESRICEIRNEVIHNSGYRPRREEAEQCLAEAGEIIHGLTGRLHLYENVNV